RVRHPPLGHRNPPRRRRVGRGGTELRGRRVARRLPRRIRRRRGSPRPARRPRRDDPAPEGGHVSSAERLTRLLALVPYVISRRSVSVAEAARAFEVTEKQLIDDLNLLWCVELRAPDPYCPIDLSYEGGEIVVSQAESMGRPLRLAVDEASALLVAL